MRDNTIFLSLPHAALHLMGWCALERLPEWLCAPKKALQHLNLFLCTDLASLPRSARTSPTLRSLDLRECHALHTLRCEMLEGDDESWDGDLVTMVMGSSSGAVSLPSSSPLGKLKQQCKGRCKGEVDSVFFLLADLRALAFARPDVVVRVRYSPLISFNN